MLRNQRRRKRASFTLKGVGGLRLVITLFLIMMLVLPTGVAIAEDPPAPTLTLTPASQDKTVGETATFTATLTDGNGAAMDGVSVQLYVGANPVGTPDDTDSEGVANPTYIGTTVGTETVTAKAIGGDVNVESTNSVTVEWLPKRTLSISPDEATFIVGTKHSVTATVKTGTGDPVQDETVEFDVTGANSESGPRTSEANGVAVFSYTGWNAGTDTVTASVDDGDGGNLSAEGSIEWVQPSIKLEPKTATNAVTVTQTIIATVTDNSGNPLRNVSVRFNVEGTNTQDMSRLTNSDGKAEFNYTSAKIGIDTVTAYPDTNQNGVLDNGEPKETATISWDSNPATGLTLNQESDTAIVGTLHTVTATIRDQSGDPSSGVLIRFSVTGVNSTTADRTTNSDGVATVAFGGTKTGKDTIKAYADVNRNGSLDVGEPSASLTVNWVSNVPASLSLAAENDSPSIGSINTFTAKVKNAGGDLLPGVTVRFSATGANSESGSRTTDNDGNATFSYSGANAGEDTVSAYADMNRDGSKDSGEPSASVNVTWLTASPSPSPSASPSPSPAPEHFGPADPAPANPNCTYYSATQHNLCGGFRDYWNKFGGLAVYGYPITEEFQENGVTTQYFERARFEWHPGSWPERSDVLLGLVGNTVTTGRSGEAPFQPTSANSNCDFHAPTGHNLCGGFRDYWNNFGGLAVYGMPISEEFAERNPDDGQVYTVQYFERARFEWHPGAWPERSDVMLGRLGARVLESKYGVVR